MSIGFELDASFGAALGELNDHFRRMNREAIDDHITIVNPQKELVSAGAGLVIADLGGPQDSFVWEVRRVSLGGFPGTAIPTVGTQCLICKGQSTAVGNQFFVDSAPIIPSAATYGSGEFIIRSPHNLLVLWAGGTGTMFIDAEVAERPKVTKLLSVL
jgi:hypothetical protein